MNQKIEWERLLYNYSYRQHLKGDAKGTHRFARWCKEWEIERELPDRNWKKLHPLGPSQRSKDRFELEDHPSLFSTRNGERIFVFQPYASEEELWEAGLAEWCQERGLLATCSAEHSWHFPGRTVLVTLTVLDERKLMKYLKLI